MTRRCASTRPRVLMVTLLMVASTAALAACGGGESSTDTPTTSTTTTAAGSSDSTAESTADSTSAASEPSTTAAPAAATASTDACVTGRWEVLADQLSHLLDATPLGSMAGFELGVTGTGAVQFRADGTYHYEPQFALTITIAGGSGSGSWSGSVDGTWSVSGTRLIMAQTDNRLSGTMTVMGQSMPLPALKSFDGAAELVDCTPATLTYRLDSPAGPIEQTLVSA